MSISDIRKEVVKYSSKMSTDEIITWNEMMQNPNPREVDLLSFLKELTTKYENTESAVKTISIEVPENECSCCNSIDDELVDGLCPDCWIDENMGLS